MDWPTVATSGQARGRGGVEQGAVQLSYDTHNGLKEVLTEPMC